MANLLLIMTFSDCDEVKCYKQERFQTNKSTNSCAVKLLLVHMYIHIKSRDTALNALIRFVCVCLCVYIFFVINFDEWVLDLKRTQNIIITLNNNKYCINFSFYKLPLSLYRIIQY